MSYFFKYNPRFFLNIKHKRVLVPCSNNIFVCHVGDVLKVFFFIKGSAFFFEGLCLSLKKKAFLLPNVSFKIVNKIQNCSVFCIFNFFFNLLFKIVFNDFKKKNYFFKKSKYFFLLKLRNIVVK